MLALELRQEFRAAHMAGTAIELRNKQNTGWAQRNPADLLRMTYPTADVQRSLEAISKAAAGRPILLKGQRGRGKSHIMALFHHAFKSPDIVERWAADWAPQLQSRDIDAKRIAHLELQRGFLPIAETLSDQEFLHLWDVIFDLHPKGPYFRGRFAQSDRAVPAKSLIRDLFAEQPTALILDEFQTWYDGLHDQPGDQGAKRRQWAFNFVQTLSELATERPDLFVLIVSVRDSSTDAYQQIWRNHPFVVDFKGETAKEDRKRLVLHRLFDNRSNLAVDEIQRAVSPYAAERVRLLFRDKSDSDKGRLIREVSECWPFAPELLDVLDEQILMASAAQDTRDLIRILAEVFRARGHETPIITVADFHVDDDKCGVASLLDSFATTADQERLRETAQRNLLALRQTGLAVPNAQPVISAIWMRSLATLNAPGATRAELQLDITKLAPVDDNGFTAELATILDNSFNIHEVGTQEKRLCFKLEENPLAKLKASARNDKLFEPAIAAPPGLAVIRRDQEYLKKFLNHLLSSPEGVGEPPCRPLVLDPNWDRAPWANFSQQDQPQHWERPVLIVVPVPLANDSVGEVLGPWLANHVNFNRNMVRFLLQKPDELWLYEDKSLLFTARCALLADEWRRTDSKYSELHRRFERELKESLKSRFDHYAFLHRWNFPTPTTCSFHIEMHGASGAAIPAAVEQHIKANHFDPGDFERFIVRCSTRDESMKQVLLLLREPPANPDDDVIPYLGDKEIYEIVIHVAAQDLIALNVGGTWFRREAGQTEEEAHRILRLRAFRTGREMTDVQLGEPGRVGGGGLTVPAMPAGSLFTQPEQSTGETAGAHIESAGNAGAPNNFPTTDHLTTPAGLIAAPVIRKSMGAKSGVNLLGDLERWAFADAQRVQQVTLTINGVSIKELRELCVKMPARLLAELQVVMPPDEGSSQ